jgi:hypothetical protein
VAVWLRPIRVRGPWEGMQILRGSETGAQTEGPVAYLARLDLSLRATVAMWGSAAPHLLHHLRGSDELLLGIPLVDRPYAQPVSFSVWRSIESAMAFDRDGGHRRRPATAAIQTEVVERFSAGRFEPYRREGTWKKRNTLAIMIGAGVPTPALPLGRPKT